MPDGGGLVTIFATGARPHDGTSGSADAGGATRGPSEFKEDSMPHTPHEAEHPRRPDHPSIPRSGSGHDAALRPDAPPLEPSGEEPHPRSPDEYTETPGSHRRGSDGAATDVGA